MARAAREAQREVQRAPQKDLSFLYEEEDGSTQFTIDESRIPDGMTYEWSRLTYVGKQDVRQQARRQRHQWTPVPNKRHPELVGSELAEKDPEGAIILDGQMLVERPAFITEKASEIRTERAKERVRNQVKSLRLTAENQMPRRVIKARKNYSIGVPEPEAAPEDYDPDAQ